MIPKYKYAVLEGDPVLVGEYEAWIYRDGKWSEMSNADAFTKAGLIPQGLFHNTFGNIESALPPTAFAADA